MGVVESINMNFNLTMNKAQELDNLAGELERMATSNLENTLQTLSRSWTGDAANAYINKGRIMENKIKSSADQLRAIAGTLRHVAQVTYNAEIQAYMIANQRW